MKITVLATLFAGLLALNPAQAGSIDLLAVWTSGGVDVDGDNNGATLDESFCTNPCGGTISAGDISDIDANQFYGANPNANVGTAQDQPDPDMINMLAFQGVTIDGLVGVKDPVSFSGKSAFTTLDFTGYLTIKAANYVWLYLIKDDGISNNSLEVIIAGQNGVSHYTEWAVAEVPLPAAAWLFLSGLVGLAGLRKSSKQ
jgi:hypothetical protein